MPFALVAVGVGASESAATFGVEPGEPAAHPGLGERRVPELGVEQHRLDELGDLGVGGAAGAVVAREDVIHQHLDGAPLPRGEKSRRRPGLGRRAAGSRARRLPRRSRLAARRQHAREHAGPREAAIFNASRRSIGSLTGLPAFVPRRCTRWSARRAPGSSRWGSCRLERRTGRRRRRRDSCTSCAWQLRVQHRRAAGRCPCACVPSLVDDLAAGCEAVVLVPRRHRRRRPRRPSPR